MSNAHSNGKSLADNSDINNNTGEVSSSPTLIWNVPMSTYAETISIVLSKTEVSTTEYSRNMDDTDTQVFSGSAKFLHCMQEICRTEAINTKHEVTNRKCLWRVTLVNADGRQNYEVRDFASFMSLVALEIGTMVVKCGKNLDHWWKAKDDHDSIILASFAEQILEVQPFLNSKKKDNA